MEIKCETIWKILVVLRAAGQSENLLTMEKCIVKCMTLKGEGNGMQEIEIEAIHTGCLIQRNFK